MGFTNDQKWLVMLKPDTNIPSQIANSYKADLALQALLRRFLSPQALKWANPVLEKTGELSAGIWRDWAQLADRHPPVLHTHDRSGRRIDNLEFHPAYDQLRAASYGDGIIAHYYDKKIRETLAEGCEIVKFAQGYLFSQAEQGLYCPICLTDGTAFLIEKFGSQDQKKRFLPRLTSTDLNYLWEGAMFLTEKNAGSDVGAIETVAKKGPNGLYTLFGEKWFCSNAGAELSMVLARPEGAPQGTRGLALFALRRHNDDGTLNQLRLERLKDKLGTRSMATGEICLNGSVAELVGDPGSGFVQMTEMLNLSRLYNAVGSLGLVRRVLSDSLSWCRGRYALGRFVIAQPMVRKTLIDLTIELEAALHLLFFLFSWRGKIFTNTATEEEKQLNRMLLPLAKCSTARLAIHAASEAIELHGGNGYIEDWSLPRFYRDAQVLPIWEGTTNILVLDAFRAMRKENAHQAFFSFIYRNAQDKRVVQFADELKQSLPELLQEPLNEQATVWYPRWCQQAIRLIQATMLLQEATDQRFQGVAKLYLLRHFAADRDTIMPSYSKEVLNEFDLIMQL